jgi:hypothetical protein
MKKIGRWFQNAFIPGEANGHRPNALRAATVVPVLITIVIIQTVFFFGSPYLVSRSRFFGLVEVSALTDGTNAARAGESVPALAVDPSLAKAAQEKADDMVASNYFAHTSPAGVTPWYWFWNVGYQFSYAGENLAVNFSESQDVTAAWMGSPEHRANILDPHFTQIGVAVAEGNFEGRPATYVAELFGTPAAGAVAPASLIPAAGAIAAKRQARPAATTVAAKPVAHAPAIPLIIATGSRNGTGSEQMSVAVEGAATQTFPATGTAATSAIPVSPQPSAAAPIDSAANPRESFLSTALANPAHTLNLLYLAILFVFVFALGLDIFIKIRVQHPDVILGGLIAISIVSIFILVNQQYFLGAVIR